MRPKDWPNYNHIGYVALSRQLGRDALQLIRHDPAAFWRSTLSANSDSESFSPASQQRTTFGPSGRESSRVLAAKIVASHGMFRIK